MFLAISETRECKRLVNLRRRIMALPRELAVKWFSLAIWARAGRSAAAILT